jgi:1-acyl-sn-glycerol-3-phosphate acyltransferase
MEHLKDKNKTGKIKKANTVVFTIFKAFIRPAIYLIYRYKFERKTAKGITRPCLILSNHQTVFDQFAVVMGFPFGINFIGSETLFRYGLKSKLMMLIARPIPFSKGNSDFIAIKNIMSVIKDGGSVGMFPSGNRSFYGAESTIVPGIGKLAKKLNVPLVLVQLRGGFFTKPRWKRTATKGKMRGVVSRVVSPEEMAAMTGAAVDAIIQKELNFNDFEYNKTAQIAYRGRRKAEYLESVLFYCPECNSMSGLVSQGDEFFCRDCGMKVRINDFGLFEKINKAEKVPDTILEWSHKQLDYIKGFDFSGFTDKPVFSDDNITFSKAERAKREHLLGKGTIAFYADRFTVCGQDFPFAETTMAVQGVRKLTIYRGIDVYAAEAPYRTNFMKYMICGYRIKNKILNNEEEYYGY